MTILDRRLPAVKALVAAQGLDSSAFLGSGSFALVYRARHPGRVVKLTIDKTSTWYLTPGAVMPKGRHKPRVYGDIDVVGVVDELPVYRIEMEQLEPLKSSPEASYLARSLSRRFNDWHVLWQACLDGDFGRLALPRSVQAFLTSLSHFGLAAFPDVGIDLRWPNQLARADGTLVFTDPVCDLPLLCDIGI